MPRLICSCICLMVLSGCGQSSTSTPQAPTKGTLTKGLTLQQITQLPPIAEPADSEAFPILSNPVTTPRVVTDRTDLLGQPVTLSCGSCHGNLPANRERRSVEDLAEFHQHLHFQHGPSDGNLSCLTCHNEGNYNQLRLADGSGLAYADYRKLCAQCHSKQDRDYEIGAHGGMNGYWDRTRGPQVRKHCIECHDPHAPKFPTMLPTFKPKDQVSGGNANAH